MPQVSSTNDPLLERALFSYLNPSWVKQPIIFGFTDRWSEIVSNLSAAAGTNLLQSAAVPAGYIYVTEFVSSLNVNTAGVRLHFTNDATNTPIFHDFGSVAAGKYANSQLQIVLKAGDKIGASFATCALNDDIYLQIWGYKMKIND